VRPGLLRLVWRRWKAERSGVLYAGAGKLRELVDQFRDAEPVTAGSRQGLGRAHVGGAARQLAGGHGGRMCWILRVVTGCAMPGCCTWPVSDASLSDPVGQAGPAPEKRMSRAVNDGADFIIAHLDLTEREVNLASIIANAIGTSWDRQGEPFTWEDFIATNWSAEPGTEEDPATWHNWAAAGTSQASAPGPGPEPGPPGARQLPGIQHPGHGVGEWEAGEWELGL